MKRLTVITGNLKKLEEIVHIIGEVPFEVSFVTYASALLTFSVPDQIVHENIDLPEYQGDLDFIVSEKCKLAAKLINGPVLVEDTSLW